MFLEREDADGGVEGLAFLLDGLLGEEGLHPVLEQFRVQRDLPEHACRTPASSCGCKKFPYV